MEKEKPSEISHLHPHINTQKTHNATWERALRVTDATNHSDIEQHKKHYSRKTLWKPSMQKCDIVKHIWDRTFVSSILR